MRPQIRGSGRTLLSLLLLLTILYTLLFKTLMLYDEGREISYVDALFWTVSTITTTGEGFQRLAYSTAALQVLSMLVQLTGLALIFAAFPLVVIPWLKSTVFENLPTSAPEKLRNHVIVCGYNALVEAFTQELKTADMPFLIVEKDKEKAEMLFKHGMPVIYGNAEEEEVLQKAGIRRASLVIANGRDEENASIILAASATKDIKILSLVEDRSKSKYLEYAGASKVVSPKSLAGIYMAREVIEHLGDKIVGPMKFYEDLKIVDLPLEKESSLTGKKLGDLSLPATIVAVRNKEGLNLNPPADYVFRDGDIITAIGRSNELGGLKDALGKKASPGHVVVIGYGDVGNQVLKFLARRGVNLRVVDKDSSKFATEEFQHVIGDGTSEQTLLEAGIDEAAVLVTVMGEDMLNIYATLLARRLNPEITIFSRINFAKAIDKAYKAGANFVTSLSLVGGEILAKMIVAPEEYRKYLQDTVTLPEGSKLYKYVITEKSPALGKSLKQCGIRKTGCMVILLKKDGKIITNPSGEDVLEEGATAIIFGGPEDIESFREKFPD